MSVKIYSDVRATCFIYCIQKLEDGRFVFLNRHYKPIGFYTSEHVDYDHYPIALNVDGLTNKVIEKLAWNGQMQGEKIYLYNDATNPITSTQNMNAYLEKLKILSKLSIAP